MTKNVILNYWFLFDPSKTWSRRSEFEDSLSKFMSEHGFEAHVVETVGDAGGPRVLEITKPEIQNMPVKANPVGRPLSTKGLVDRFTGRNKK